LDEIAGRLAEISLKEKLCPDWLQSTGTDMMGAEAIERGLNRTVLSLNPRRENFVCREPAVATTFKYMSTLFSRGFGKPPICTILGSPGSGKTEIFSQIVHAFWTQEFAGLGGSGTMTSYAADTLCVAVTMNCSTPIFAEEQGLGLERLVILRLYFIWMSEQSFYSNIIRQMDLHSICANYTLADVIYRLCSICGKSRCVLLIDESVRLLQTTGDKKAFIEDIKSVASQQNDRFAVVFSSLLLDPFLVEVSGSNREIVKVPMNLLEREDVASRLLPELVKSIPNHLAMQSFRAGAGCHYVGLARAIGGFPRLIEFAAKIIAEEPDTTIAVLVDKAISRYSSTEKLKSSLEMLLFDVMVAVLSDQVVEGHKYYHDNKTYSCDDLVSCGLLHRHTTECIIVPQFALMMYCRMLPRNENESALQIALSFLFAGEGINGSGKPWELLCLSVDRIQRIIRNDLATTSMLGMFAPVYKTSKFSGHTLSPELLAGVFELCQLKEVVHFSTTRDVRDTSVEKLLSCVWYPVNQSNAGFDYAVFILPVGTAREFNNVVAVVTECKFSSDNAKTSWTTVAEKQRKAVHNASSTFGIDSNNIIFRVAPWRHLPEPTQASIDALPRNIIAQSKENLCGYMGTSLSLIVDNLAVFTA
jgi:hypothetical protein